MYGTARFRFSTFLALLMVSSVNLPTFSESTCRDATLRLPALFSDHMVLQRDEKVPVWGWAASSSEVVVSVGSKTSTTKAGEDGRWETHVGPFPAGGPHTMAIAVPGQKIILQDILFGDVWICSGQSNMQWLLYGARNAEKEIADAKYPDIRLFTVSNVTSLVPLDDVRKCIPWLACTPETASGFSAVGYFFGRDLYDKLNVPIGLIHTAWGGTAAEAWTDSKTLSKLPDFAYVPGWLAKANKDSPELEREYRDSMKEWSKLFQRSDAGNPDGQMAWAAPSTSTEDWKTMKLPTFWELAGYYTLDGVVWFRKEIEVPEDWAGKPLDLHLGSIDDMDITWFNGTKVGETMEEGCFNVLRNYIVPGALVKGGKNCIVVRVQDNGGAGGLYGVADILKLTEPTSGQSLPLAGDWRFKIGCDVSTLPPRPRTPPGVGDPNTPATLYNAMVHPLIPYRIKGAIWYQGEANVDRAYQYRTLFPSLINGWRREWGEGDFPFCFVQLANYQAVKEEPTEDAWAELREAQAMALSLPNTGMAVIIDIGDANDIHPRNKQDVGKRLSLAARHVAYGEDLIYSGPTYDSMRKEGNKIRIRFNNTGERLCTPRNEPLKGFSIAAEQGHFKWARATIEGDSVVVWCDDIANPVAVRYAWAINPVCNLYNSAMLPASPFRTDDWPCITKGNIKPR